MGKIKLTQNKKRKSINSKRVNNNLTSLNNNESKALRIYYKTMLLHSVKTIQKMQI